MDWQPIETAPKDCYVAVWPPTWEGVISCARWYADNYSKRPRPHWKRTDAFGGALISHERPRTHWAPIPEPPKAVA